MKKLIRIFALAALSVLPVLGVGADTRPEWKIRPWEIMQGLQPRSATLWDVKTGDLAQWSVRGKGELSETSITKLWNETVAKLTIPANGSITIMPPAPIKVEKRVDGLELWLYGPHNGGEGHAPAAFLMVTDAKNQKLKLKLSGSGSRWAGNRWWGAGAVLIPEKAVFPLEITAIRFEKLAPTKADDFLCFDHLGAFNLTKPQMLDVDKVKLPFPTTPDGIMPVGTRPGATNRVEKKGGKYLFTYHGPDCDVVYTYAPKTGTLSDLTATVSGKTFQPAYCGGVHAFSEGMRFESTDSTVEATLVSASLKGQKLFTTWRCSKGGKNLQFKLNFRIKGKSLEVEASTAENQGFFFDAGEIRGVDKPRMTGFSYLHNRWAQPQFLVTDDFFVSVFLDWYYSHASSLTENGGGGGLPEAAVTGENSARIMGGSVYTPRTNGKYNALYERFYITVSPEVQDVLPNIPNPPSRFLAETGSMLCCTRMHAIQEGHHEADLADELAFWGNLKDYGAGDWFVRFHEEQFRTPLENNRFCRSLDGGRQIGGDETLKKLVAGMLQVVRRTGTYDNPRIVHPYAPEFNYSEVALFKDGSFLEGWDGCFRPKCTVSTRLQGEFVPKFVKKYGWNAEYLDEVTNAPPWADVDYDAKSPGAGMFSTVLKCYGWTVLKEKEMYNGPVWSEGCAAYFWAGLLDVDYATSNESKTDIPLVDFKLLKIKPLENYTGVGWDILYSGDVDLQIATQIAYGSTGHMPGRLQTHQPGHGRIHGFTEYGKALRNYFLMRQVQELYNGLAPDAIRYEIGGKMLSASEMLRGNHANSGRIYAHYPNGLETWVNRGAEGDWVVKVGNETLTLPPKGHAAYCPGKLLQYTAQVDGHLVDYSRGTLYTYLSGRGNVTKFPEMTAAGAYLLRSNAQGETELIPEPFEKAETLTILAAKSAEPKAQNGTPCGAVIPLDGGKLNVDGKAFRYVLR